MDPKTEIEVDDTWCHYSDLPSPIAYVSCMDYDGIGNQGRVVVKN
jgi:hypothetical protein